MSIIIPMLHLVRIAVGTIFCILFVAISVKAKKSGNYLDAIYNLCWAIIFYIAATT